MRQETQPFEHELGAKVQLVASAERGIVTARAQYIDIAFYRVLYCAPDGRQVEKWWTSEAVVAAR